ncbi:MAG: CDF family Co(II)/Ni(II) efflux transporter DmeF [Lentisphaeraceae bacterium]|nr:CDF family Co(II)/Ni(II) efflux transporter DmeF [Lentisphaeraceae bacterium]
MSLEDSLGKYKHSHNFSVQNSEGETRTKYVLVLTVVTMVVEISAGSIYGSMALLADGWHMGTHAAAFLLTIYAYSYARKNADNPKFSFGTGKVNVLGGFASAVALAVVALVMLLESLFRLFNPEMIQFNQAIAVAVIGLIINIVSAFLLKDHHHHDHHHGHEEHDHHHHDHDHEHHHHHDHNLKAAYLHVLVDAMTSLLAIIALLAGKYYGWHGLDPVMGIVGAVIITRWSLSLIKQTSPILLDNNIQQSTMEKIKKTLENDEDKISDLHVWKISGNHYAAIISIVSSNAKSSEVYKGKLIDFEELTHISIEVNSV